MMENNEEKGRADNNPYAQALYRRYLLPLIDAIKEAQEASGRPGRRAAHVSLLAGLEPATVAALAVRDVLMGLMQNSHEEIRVIGRRIGITVQRELALTLMQVSNPEILWALQYDLDRRHSKNSRHRFNAIAGGARNKGITLMEWGPVEREQVGLWLCEQLRVLGMLEVETSVTKGRFNKGVSTSLISFLSDECMSLVGNIKEAVELTMPYHLPCVEQPKDWLAFNDGGYYTQEMRVSTPYCVATRRSGRKVVEQYKSDPSLTAALRSSLNAQQGTRWQVNTDLLDAVELVAKHMDTAEILMQAELPKPCKPDWLLEKMDKGDMSPDQLEEFTQWKRQMAEWHTEAKLRFTKIGRYGTAIRVANRFKNEAVLHFVYQADFRGRAYALTTGISPQGSDLQKALLRFADGKAIQNESALKWFKILGANKFGIDKVTHGEQLAWVDDNDQHIVEMGNDPISNRGWLEADSPLQFLAWCQEWAAYKRSPKRFVSRLPVGLDGSCNGLQHFSAMLRDSIGGKATNLLVSERPNDIYAQVARVVTGMLERTDESALSEKDAEYRRIWMKHGINRTLVKRSVMTLPYGSTRFSCSDYIVGDYLRFGKVPEFAKEQYNGAANFLSFRVWNAIGEVVIAARTAMDWLRSSASQMIKKGESDISWTTPTGFKVYQVYQEADVMTVNSLLLGGVRIRIGTTSDTPSLNLHKNGLSPNFVHSMDASHMCLTTLAAKAAGIDSLAMIHDDYGTHAADAEALYAIIREKFVDMYSSHDPLQSLKDKYEFLKAVPAKGDLDLQQVLKSPYFFT